MPKHIFPPQKFAEVQSPMLGDFFPKHCPTANTTTEAWLKAKGGWWDINFNNPPPCRFPFNYKGGHLSSMDLKLTIQNMFIIRSMASSLHNIR